MADRPTNQEREELIVGDRTGLDPADAADLTLLAELLGDPSTWAEPPDALEDAVVHAVAAAEPGAARAIHRTRHTAVARPRRPIFAVAAAAAVVAVGVGAMVVVAGRGGSGPDYEGELAAAAEAPGASATVDVTQNDSGFRITLDAEGLPDLLAGEFYQGWLKNSVGTLVPIGTFSSGDDRVTLWSGVSPADFPTLTVTIETADNDQNSSGRLVLAGEVHEG
jgi:hypothetical protein